MKKSADALMRCALRAEELAAGSATAAAPLRFAAGLYRAQAAVAARIPQTVPLLAPGELERHAAALLDASSELIAFIAQRGPSGLRDVAMTAAGLVAHVRERRSAEDAEGFVARAVLRPHLEGSATHARSCGPPWIAARRASGDGAARWLCCAWCGGEQPVNRIVCPACGETDPVRLPVFQSDTFASVRIEACETCHRYVKSIDLTLDARPIPEVDDLSSLSMDLWAREQGFLRVEPGLAGI